MERKLLRPGFTCNICKRKIEVNGYVIGLKEAFTKGQTVMIRMCDRCYDHVTSHMIDLAKTLPKSAEKEEQQAIEADLDVLKSLGITWPISS